MSKLWIPPSAVEPEAGKRYLCVNCGTRFMRGHRQQYQRHVVACIRKNPERIEEHAHLTRNNGFTGILDKEQYAFVRKRAAEGKRATRGGRAT